MTDKSAKVPTERDVRPCPFGGDHELSVYSFVQSGQGSYWETNGVACLDCGAGTKLKISINEWNALSEERERAEELVELLKAQIRGMTTRMFDAEERGERYEKALKEIADKEWTELVLDPTWAQRIAKEALPANGTGGEEGK